MNRTTPRSRAAAATAALTSAALVAGALLPGCFSTEPPFSPCASDSACPADQHCDLGSGLCATGVPQPPPAPAAVSVAIALGRPQVSWTAGAGAPADTTYKVVRATDGANTFSTVAAPAVAPYTDSSASPGHGYSYAVLALRGGLPSAQVAASPAQVTVPVLPPVNVALTRVAGVPTLSWTAAANADAATLYRVLRSPDGSTFAAVGGDSAASPFSDSNSPPGGISYYQVQTVANGQLSSPVASVPTSLAVAPQPPTQVVLTLVAGTPRLTWTAPAGALPGLTFEVDRSANGGAFSAVATVAAPPFNDLAANPGSTVAYRVLGVQNGLASSAVASAPASQLVPLLPPGSVVVALSGGVPVVTFMPPANANAGTLYQLQRSSDGLTFANLGAPGTATTVTDSTAAPGGVYYYQALSVQGPLSSAPAATSPASIALPPAAATGVAVTVPASGFPLIAWSAPVGALPGILYQVLRAQGGGAPQAVGSPTAQVQLTDTNATPGATFSYLVQSVQNGLTSAAVAAAPSSIAVPLLPPSGVSLSLSASGLPLLTWTPPVNALASTQYQVLRSTDGALFTTLGGLQSSTSTSDGTAKPGGLYYYSVETVQGAATSTPAASTPDRVALPPSPPSGVALSVDVSGFPAVTWTPPAGALPGIQYQVLRGSAAGALLALGGPTAAAQLVDTTAIPGNTFFYAVRSVQNGASSASVASAPGSTSGPLLAPPAATVTLSGNGYPLISWTLPTNALSSTSYQITRSTSGPPVNGIASPLALAPPYEDATALKGSVYSYGVYTVVPGPNATQLASAVTAAAPSPLAVPPWPPVSPTVVDSSGVPLLSWGVNPSAQPGAQYQVLRSTNGGPFAAVGGPIPATQLADSTAITGTPYGYQVESVQNGATSTPVNTSPATLTTAVQPPTNVTLANASGVPTLQWTAANAAQVGGAYVTRYTIYRGTDGTTFAPIDSTSLSSYGDTTAIPGGLYYYQVATSQPGPAGAHSSAPVASSPAKVQLAPAPPASATASLQNGVATVKWTAPTLSLPGIKYQVERGASAGSVSPLGAPVSALSYVDSTAAAGNTYYYAVYSVQNALNSGATAAGSITLSTPPPPPPPSVSVGYGASATQVLVSFVGPSQAPPSGFTYSYLLLRDSGAGPAAVGGLQNGSPFSDLPPAGGTYTYSVETTLLSAGSPTNNFSAPTTGNPASITVLPGPVTGLAAGAVACNSIPLSWSAVFGAASYTVSGPNGLNVSATSTSYTDTQANLASSSNYSYTVSAKNAAGSGLSASTTATTVLGGPVWRDFNNLQNSATSTYVYAGDNQATMQWTAPAGAGGSTTYTLSRGAGASGPLSSVATFAQVGTLSYTDTGLSTDTLYRYQLTANGALGPGCPSVIQSGTTGTGGTDLHQLIPAVSTYIGDTTDKSATSTGTAGLTFRSQRVTSNAITTYFGEGSSDGLFTVPNGNLGGSLITAGGKSTGYFSTARLFDLAGFGFGSGTQRATSTRSTPVTFNFSGLNPWNNTTDSLQVLSLNLGFAAGLEQVANTPPTPGSTSVSLVVDWQSQGVPLFDPAQGDVLTVAYQTAGATSTPFAYSAVTKGCSASFSPAALVDGSPATASCNLASTNLKSTTLNLLRSQFKSAAIVNAILSSSASSTPDTVDADSFQIFAAPGPPAYPFVSQSSGNIVLASMTLDAKSTDVTEQLIFANPLGPKYGLFYSYGTVLAAQSFYAPGTPSCPTPGPSTQKYGYSQQEPLAADGSLPASIAPEIQPALNIKVSKLPAGPSGSNVQVQWNEPVAGANPPTIYTAYLWKLTANASCGSDASLIYRLRTIPGQGGALLPATAFTTQDNSGAYFIQVNTGWRPDEQPNYVQPNRYAQGARVVTVFTYSGQFTH